MPALSHIINVRPRSIVEYLARRPLRRRMIANTGWLVGDKILRLGLGVWLGAWIARYLGPAQFGALSFALATVALCTALATAGVAEILVRDLVRMPERRTTLMASAFVMRIVGSLATIALALAATAILKPGADGALVLVAVVALGPVAQAMDIIDLRYQAVNDFRVIIVLRWLAFALVSAGRIAALLLHAKLPVFAALTAGEFIVGSVLMWWLARSNGRAFALSDFRFDECRRLFREGWILMARGLAIGVYMRIDQVMIGRLLNDRSVGLYVAAVRLSEIWYLIPVAAMTALAPKLTETYERSKVEYEAQLTFVMRLLAWSAIMFAAVLGIAATPLVVLLFGQRYAEAGPVLALHAWGGVAVTLGAVASTWLINAGLVRYGLYQCIATAAFSVIGNLILIPAYGIAGAAITVIASNILSAILLNGLFPATRPLFRMQMRALWLPSLFHGRA